MDLLIWLAQLPDETLATAMIVLTCALVGILSIAVVIMALPEHKHKVTHISGFNNRKAKKGELKK